MKKVFISGCFDVLHGGHVEFFSQAKELGDHLTVCVASDKALLKHKGRKSSIPVEHKKRLIESLAMVDEAVISTGESLGLDFEREFMECNPDVLAVTEDDRYEAMKRALCDKVGAEYVKLPKTLGYEKISTTEIIDFIKAPTKAPLRVDFAGGWLDVPKHVRPHGYVVNCTIEPLVSLKDWTYELSSGLGGSATYAYLMGQDSVQSELNLGVGWQDPAVVQETGLCVWHSGKEPELDIKRDPSMLRNNMALYWTGESHHTPSLVNKKRDYDKILNASHVARSAVVEEDIQLLCVAVGMSYEAQIDEGMEELPGYGEISKKYLGGGYGGYALYIFETYMERDTFVRQQEAALRIEPYIRGYR